MIFFYFIFLFHSFELNILPDLLIVSFKYLFISDSSLLSCDEALIIALTVSTKSFPLCLLPQSSYNLFKSTRPSSTLSKSFALKVPLLLLPPSYNLTLKYSKNIMWLVSKSYNLLADFYL